MYITDAQMAAALVARNSGMSLEEIIKSEADLWLASARRARIADGSDYYCGRQKILGKKQRNPKRTNTRRAHPFVRKLVDQKAGYLLSSPFDWIAEDARYQAMLDEVAGQGLRKLVMDTGRDALKCGIAWWQPYFNEGGELRFRRHRPWEISPLWADDERRKLAGFIRVWEREEWVARERKLVRYVTYGDDKRFLHYRYRDGGGLEPVGAEPHFTVSGVADGGERQSAGWSWNRVPLVYWKANDEEQGVAELVKGILDDYDLQASKHSDLLADLAQVVYVLKGYGGNDLGGFVNAMQKYMAIKVDAETGGGVDTLSPKPEEAAVEALLARTRQNLYEFGRGIDTQSEDLGNASGQAIKFRYGDLDIDCDTLEREFQSSFEQVEWFVKAYLKLSGRGDFSGESAQVVFHRDMLVNEKEIVDMCVASKGIISDQTIMERHPWAAEDEEERLRKQEEDALDRAKEFQNAFKPADGTDGSGGGENNGSESGAGGGTGGK
jgi:SPP1 family phage portal protein